MTIINGIEIDDITYHFNEIKSAIMNNDSIEDKLNNNQLTLSEWLRSR